MKNVLKSETQNAMILKVYTQSTLIKQKLVPALVTQCILICFNINMRKIPSMQTTSIPVPQMISQNPGTTPEIPKPLV